VQETVLEILELDGGWLTKDGITLCFNREPSYDSITKVLARLRNRGLVISRVRPTAGNHAPIREYRTTL